MAAQDYTGVVQQLYISYFGRPADYFGLKNFTEQLNALGAPTEFAALQARVQADAAGTSPLTKLMNTFSNSPESIALYGNDTTQLGVSKFVAAIYQNVLGREADIPGFNFWVNAITSGSLSKANAAAAISAGATANTTAQGVLDAQTVANKLSVATTFTAALDTPTEFNAYAGDNAAAAGRSLLQGVNNTTNLTSYQANINDTISTIVNVAQPGTTVSLTVGVDTPTGSAGDDIFNAIPQNVAGESADTLGSFDVIDGGAGKDTLNIYTGGTGGTTFNTTQQGMVKNVETINIYNATGATFASAGIDAAKFVGATNINQVGNAATVNNLSASTTATFTTVSTDTTAINVNAAAGVSAAKVALSGVTGETTAGAGQNAVAVNVGGAALSSVTVSGTIATADATFTTTPAVALNVTTGANASNVSVDTLTVNTAMKTTLTVTKAAGSTGDVTSINAAGSTGGITFAAGAAVATIVTGAGADVISGTFTTSAAAGTTAAKNASIMTGEGKDNITVASAANSTGLTTVDAGAGDDTITVTKLAGAGLNIQGGEGNDTVAMLGTVALATTDVINGGAGTDTISVAGSASARTADDFIVFNKLITNFETIKFSSAEGVAAVTSGTPVPGVALNASLLGANYTTIDLANNSFVSNVGTQAIVANGNLTVSTTGYKAPVAAAGSTPAADAVYAGTLSITEKVTGTVTANADVVNLTVAAGTTTAGVVGTLAGDAKSAIVTVTNGLTTGGTADTAASFVLNTGNGNAEMTSVTVSGTGSATITNAADSALVNVDASALAGKATVGATAGTATAGLTYVSSNAAVETIKLGAGIDNITVGASTYGAVDTISGLNLVLATGGTALAATSDVLDIGGVTGAFVKFTTTQTDFDLALKDAAAYAVSGTAANNLVFSFGGDTYVYSDAGTANEVDSADVLVKLTGTVNLDTLVIALG